MQVELKTMLQPHLWTKFFQIKWSKKVKLSSMNIAISQNIFSVQMLGNLIRKTLKLYTYINYSGNKNPNTMCDIPKDSEKWVESKYAESERLGIVPGTWFDEKRHLIASSVSFYDILYTVRFVKMRGIQRYHFCYVIHAGKWPPQQNTAFLIWQYVNDAVLM